MTGKVSVHFKSSLPNCQASCASSQYTAANSPLRFKLGWGCGTEPMTTATIFVEAARGGLSQEDLSGLAVLSELRELSLTGPAAPSALVSSALAAGLAPLTQLESLTLKLQACPFTMLRPDLPAVLLGALVRAPALPPLPARWDVLHLSARRHFLVILCLPRSPAGALPLARVLTECIAAGRMAYGTIVDPCTHAGNSWQSVEVQLSLILTELGRVGRQKYAHLPRDEWHCRNQNRPLRCR